MTTTIEVCLIIITVILVTRSLIEMMIVIGISGRIRTVVKGINDIVKQMKSVSGMIHDGTNHVKDTVHEITDGTKKKLESVREILDKLNESLFLLNTVLKGITGSLRYFFKDKTESGDD